MYFRGLYAYLLFFIYSSSSSFHFVLARLSPIIDSSKHWTASNNLVVPFLSFLKFAILLLLIPILLPAAYESISAPTYTAGENITIDQNNEISADVNTKTFQWNRWIWYFANAQAVYDRISTWKYAIVEVRNVGDDWKWSVVFWPTNITTGTISSWEYTHATQSTIASGLYYEEYMKLVIEVVNWVVTQAYDSGSTINNSGHLVVKGDTAPSSPIQWSVWYDKTNNQLKTYDGTNWNQVGWWLQVAPNSPITWIKYVWYGTEADYNNLSQYYTDAPWDTEFRCF